MASTDEVERFGYEGELHRTIGGRASFALSFSTISVTVGVLQAYGLMLSTTGPFGVLTWPCRR